MITLPSNVQWVGDIGVFVVEGDDITEWNQSDDALVAQYGIADDERTFVTLWAWAQYDKPCETCGGEGFLAAPIGDDPACTTMTECPRCRDGRQVWEVRWESTECLDPESDRHCRHWRAEHRCCYCEGYLSARAAIEVVPVVSRHSPTPEGNYVRLITDEHHPAVLWVDGVLLPAWTADPLPRPGRDFVVVVRKVAS